MKNKFCIIVLATLLEVNLSFADPTALDRVRLFDSFFVDAVRLDSPYAEIGAGHRGFESGNTIPFQIRGGAPIASNIDIGASIGGINVDPDFGHEQMDVSDLSLVGRYHFTDFKPVNLTAGMRFDFPTGDNDQGQDTLEFEAFGAIRIPVTEKLVTAAHLGFGYVETHELDGISGVGDGFIVNGQQVVPVQLPGFDPLQFNSANVMTTANGVVGSPPGARIKNEGDFAFFASAGIIYEINSALHVMGEFSGDTGHDVGYFTSGVDYEVIPNGRLRFGVGAGFGERAPEYTIQGGFLFNFGS